MKESLIIRILEEKDVTEGYVKWFKEKEIVEYSDNQYRTFTIDTQREYIQSKTEDSHSELYGIFFSTLHIGNIVIDKIDKIHKRAELTYVIGEKDYWGKGIATIAIKEMIKISKTELNLKKLYASCAHKNEASRKVLIKNGFEVEGIRKKHLFYNSEWLDQVDFGLIL